MNCIAMTASVAVLSLVTSPWLIGQSRRQQHPSAQSVEELRDRPNLGIDFALVAKFKLASRKSTYRTGEMVSIDLAMMNVSGAPVFLHKLSRPTLDFKGLDAAGQPVSINPYYVGTYGVSPNSYQQIEPGYVLSESFELLTGCNDAELQIFSQEKRKLEEEERRGGERVFFKGLFERDLFVNWGDACFAIKSPGTYTITAEQSNNTVIVTKRGPKVKTAIGTIRSAPLVITIID